MMINGFWTRESWENCIANVGYIKIPVPTPPNPCSNFNRQLSSTSSSIAPRKTIFSKTTVSMDMDHMKSFNWTGQRECPTYLYMWGCVVCRLPDQNRLSVSSHQELDFHLFEYSFSFRPIDMGLLRWRRRRRTTMTLFRLRTKIRVLGLRLLALVCIVQCYYVLTWMKAIQRTTMSSLADP